MIINICLECRPGIRGRMLNAGYDKPEGCIITCFVKMDDVGTTTTMETQNNRNLVDRVKEISDLQNEKI